LVEKLFGGGGAVDAEPADTEEPADTAEPMAYVAPGGVVPPLPSKFTNVANSQLHLPPAEDLNAMVRTIIGEAGNQSPEGQRAVAEVILNRARQSGMTPMQVVMAKGQFEPWATRGPELNAIDPNSAQYQSVLANIMPAFGEGDPTGGADHFYSPGAQAALGRDTPAWARGQTGRDIGDHRFYALGYGGDAGTSDAQDAIGQQVAGLSIDANPNPDPRPAVGQVAQAGGFDPRIFDALNDPWVPEGDKAVLEAILERRMKQMFPDPVDYGFTTENGDIYATNPREGTAKRIIDNPDPLKPTSDIQNYEYDVQNGFRGTFHDWKIETAKAGAAQLPGEMGARIGLGDSFIQELNLGVDGGPSLRERIKTTFGGDEANQLKGRAQLAIGAGEAGSIWRSVEGGKEALIRQLTGAGMGMAEAQQQAARYSIAATDGVWTMLDKMDGLQRHLEAVRRGAIDARTGGITNDSGTPAPGSDITIEPLD
jgi:hypothetical protein